MFLGLGRQEENKAPRRTIHTVLVVEDEPLVAFDNEHRLEQAGYEIAATVNDYHHAVAVIDEGGVDLVIADIGLHGDRSGVDVARHAAAKALPVLFVTGRCPIDAQSIAMGCLAKPYGSRDLVASIKVIDAVLRGTRRPRLPPGLMLFDPNG